MFQLAKIYYFQSVLYLYLRVVFDHCLLKHDIYLHLIVIKKARELVQVQVPTIRNCKVELQTFTIIVGINTGQVQCKNLTLEEALS